MTATEPIDLGLPATTMRLVLRPARLNDTDVLTARRNQPLAARFQSWPHPYPRDDAEAMLTALATMAGPTPGEWWLAMVDHDGANIGDVAIGLDDTGTMAEVGYNLNPDVHGRGFATEAVEAVVATLFDRHSALVRVESRMHPDHHASSAVAERCGFVFEGRIRQGFPPRPQDQSHSDGLVYGLTRADHDTWTGRQTGRPTDVSLVEVTGDNLDQVYDLATHRSQGRLVAPVPFSLAQAHHPPRRDGPSIEAWYRAVVADGEIAGFVMVGFSEGRPPYLWRMLIDRMHQRRGVGRRALDLVVDEARRRGGTELTVSWMPGPGSPEPFYLGYGFRSAGEPDDDGEIPGLLSI